MKDLKNIEVPLIYTGKTDKHMNNGTTIDCIRAPETDSIRFLKTSSPGGRLYEIEKK